jgi:hypothetical protein
VGNASNSRPSAQHVLSLHIIGACVLICTVLALTAVFLHPRNCALFSKLNQRGVAYKHVFIDRTWPDTVNDVTYGAKLLITTLEKGELARRLDCRGWQTDCFFTVRELGIYREALPELT